jgi:hypothetical protein
MQDQGCEMDAPRVGIPNPPVDGKAQPGKGRVGTTFESGEQIDDMRAVEFLNGRIIGDEQSVIPIDIPIPKDRAVKEESEEKDDDAAKQNPLPVWKRVVGVNQSGVTLIKTDFKIEF